MASITKLKAPVICGCQRRYFRRNSLSPVSISTVRLHLPTVNLQVASSSSSVSVSAVVETTPVEISDMEDINTDRNILGCPVCYSPLTWSGESSISVETVSGTTLQCNTCKKSYNGKESQFDLTVGSGSKNYVESMPLVTEFFSAPAMSFIYERGWRQNFGLGGYPGADREGKDVIEWLHEADLITVVSEVCISDKFEMAMEYFKPVLGGNIVDASCGSGLFSRRFAKSGLFSLVVALDYSAAMLRQCLEFVEEDSDFPKEKLTLVRADISRLPFVSGTIDAVHAGAALHCWPSPSSAVAEISRILRPGGVFVATTTIGDGPFSLVPFRNTFREYLQQYSGSRVFLSERELRDLCTTCGLTDFRCTRNGLFVMISATKPV